MNERKLIKKIKKKDEKALVIFIDSYGKIIKGAISPILISHRELMDEALNDAVLAIWENIDSYDPKRSSFKNWCAGIGKYKAIDLLRKEIRHQSVSLDKLGDKGKSDYIDLDEREEILSYLSPEDKILFEKLFIEGYSYDDIAKEEGVSKNALYNRVSRGRKVISLNLREGKNEK